MRSLSVLGLFLVIAVAIQGFGNTEGGSDHDILIPGVPSLEITPEMEAFLQAQEISAHSIDARKIDALLHGLFGANWKDFTYVPTLTLAPEEAFMSKQGNCMTFAMLFVTLARGIGLDAVFNEIDRSPNWTMEGEVVVETGHINIIVESQGHKHVVEWDDAYKDFANLILHPISDERAFSHYFNNLGIQALSKKDYPEARALFEKALELDSTNSDAWQNYGVYWVHQGIMDRAEKAFLEGIKVSDKRSSLYFLLSKFYEHQGDKTKASSYLKKGERHAKNNPFYHFNKAMEAKKQGDEQQVLESLKTAIQKLPEYHLFHYELARCYYRLSRMDEWKKAMDQALQCTESPETQQKYREELNQVLGLPQNHQSQEDNATPDEASFPDGLYSG